MLIYQVYNVIVMHHYRKTWSNYRSQPKSESCQFCDPNDMNPRIVFETDHCFVIPNRVSYDVWELRDVTDHLLVIPKQHISNLAELADEARHDIMDVIAKYEASEYNIYARTATNTNRSVPHQHTHLIKTNNEVGHGLLLVRKPYVFMKF